MHTQQNFLIVCCHRLLDKWRVIGNSERALVLSHYACLHKAYSQERQTELTKQRPKYVNMQRSMQMPIASMPSNGKLQQI